MSTINKYAVIVAGGKGARMGGDVPKQFMHLCGKPLLCYSIQTFAKALPDIRIILVAPEDQLKSAEIIARTYLSGIDVSIVAGGPTRYHSVRNGLKKIPDDGGIVFIHDGARPLLSERLILRCLRQAEEKGNAVPAVPVKDSMRYMDKSGHKILDREKVRVIQTPQTFRTGIILPAFQQPYLPSFTDEATVVEAIGKKIYLIDGEQENIKVTTPDDMLLAEALLKTLENAASAEAPLPADAV